MYLNRVVDERQVRQGEGQVQDDRNDHRSNHRWLATTRRGSGGG